MRIRVPKFRRPKINPHHLAVFIKGLAFLIGAFIIFMLFRINAQNQLIAQQSKDLAQAAKNISEQNQRIARLNGQHIDCLADLFAKYTRENRPISIEDLDLCKVTSEEAAALMSGAVDFTPLIQPTTPAPTPKSNDTNSAPKDTSQPPQQTLPISPTPTPAPVPNPPKEILGIPVCVPFTGVCVR